MRFLVFVVFVVSSTLNGVEGCIFRTWNIFPPAEIQSPSASNGLMIDKETMSILQQTFVKTWITMGKMQFRCPAENGTFPDALDCRKYYECSNFNFTVSLCENGTGYERLATTCINEESVPLCRKVKVLPDYSCNGTGLQTYEGYCDQFILCTKDSAFVSSCNKGDFFDQNLKLCLPQNEANCTLGKHSEAKVTQESSN